MSGLLPTGTVTLVLADVEGSTRLCETQPDDMTAVLARFNQTVSEVIAAHGGVRPVEQGEGDSFVAAFARASDAVGCALELQRAPLAPIRLRIGVHTGEVQLRDEDNYAGPTINRTARLRDLAHGGQTVLSGATEDMVVDRLPAGAWLTDLGTHLLRDLPRPERVVQLCHPDLRNDFPPKLMPANPERNGEGYQRPRVVDYIVEHLARRGIRHVFGVGGANIEDLYDAAHSCPGITAVVAKHEFSAAAMADGYSRASAGVGVVAATSGGGALNTIPGLGESLASRVPVLALIGQAPTTSDGGGAFQDSSGANGALDGNALFSAVSVSCQRVLTPADIVAALPRALSAATSMGGPAVLLLPKDIQQGTVELVADDVPEGTRRRVGDPTPVVDLLRRADGPVMIIAGDQIARDDARAELEQLRAVLTARVATVPDAKDVVAGPGSPALGVTGVMGHPAVSAALAESAVCLLVGTRLPLIARSGLDEALWSTPTASIGSAPPYLPCTHVDSDDLRASLTLVTAALTENGHPKHERTPYRVARNELAPPPHEGPGVRYRDAMLALDALLPHQTDIVVDAGNIGAAAIHWLPARRDGRFLVALGMGGMGYSFGAGIGMAFARLTTPGAKSTKPQCRAVVLAGDGAFFMHGMEIHTALHYRLPVIFVLFDNHAHAMCATREQLFYGDRYSYNRFGPSRLGAGLAAMFPTLPAMDVTDIGELGVAIKAALAVEGPSVVAVECSADEIPPFAPFLAEANAKGFDNKECSTTPVNS